MYNFCDSGEDGENIRYLNEGYKAFGISLQYSLLLSEWRDIFFELLWHVFVYHFSSGPHGYILES